MQFYGRILTNKGYKESKKKPNLFYKIIPEGQLFANMQGTEEVPIWSNPRPLFHWRLNPTTPKWKKGRIIKTELTSLFKAKCPCRFSFYFSYEPNEELERNDGEVDEEKGIYNWNDGYCEICGKDFQGEGAFCSEKCEVIHKIKNVPKCNVCKKPRVYSSILNMAIKYDDLFCLEKCEVTDIIKHSPKCRACGKPILNKSNLERAVKYYDENLLTSSVTGHHTNYAQDKKIPVCKSCHLKIHRTNYRPLFKPEDARSCLQSNTLENKNCLDCKSLFQPKHRNQIYCKACLTKLPMKQRFPRTYKLAEKHCLDCNDSFQPRHQNQTYCTVCLIKLPMKQRSEKPPTCRGCGEVFEPQHEKQRYCTKCLIKNDWVNKTYG